MKKYFILTLIPACFLSACKPVNSFTKAKKRPAVYTENFLGDTIRMPRSEAGQSAWIVYSLSDKNPTTLKPGGKVVVKEMSMMEPMLVIGSKRNGKYLKLVKYNPEILKNEKLTNRKKADYYGWADRSQLLLCNTSSTDVRTGFKNLAFTAISDTTTLFYPESFMEQDSVKLFADPRLSEIYKYAALYQLIYQYQLSADGKKWLIGSEPSITADNASDIMLGWIDARMIENAGQRVWYAPADVSASQSGLLQIAPVIAPSFPDSAMTFRTITTYNAIDPGNNVIYNVEGNAISYNRRLEIERELKRLNIYFSIEPSASLNSQLPSMINAIQNMIPFFADKNEYDYTFTLIAGNNQSTTQSSVTGIVNWMVDHMDQLVQSPTEKAKPWQSLDMALNLAMQAPASTNFFINIGENITSNVHTDKQIVDKLNKANGRLLAFQLYAKENDSYNNYVLQATDIIEGYAARQIENKRNLWVYADQVRRANSFSENTHNNYMLDYPANSATQGMIVFPTKGEYLTTDALVSSTETLLNQVKEDNQSLIAAFNKAFSSTDNAKDRYDQKLHALYNLKQDRKIDEGYRAVFQSQNIPWTERTKRITLMARDTLTQPVFLLITEKESEPIKSWLEEVTRMSVDIHGTKKSPKKKTRSLVQVRNELRAMDEADLIADLDLATDSTELFYADSSEIRYASTRKIRKHLYRTFKEAVRKSGRIECDNAKWRKEATLSDVQQLYTMLPAVSPYLQDLKLSDIRNANILTDEQLDQLITYLKFKLEEFDNEITSANEVISGNMKFYKINRNRLP